MAGELATVFPLAPSVHFHPHSQAGAVTKVGNRITGCPDLRGLAAASGLDATGAVIGPTEMTDGNGVKFWRFSGAEALWLTNALNGMSSRGYTCFAVARVHNNRASMPIFRPRYASYTNDATNAPANVAIIMLSQTVLSGSGGFVGGQSTPHASSNAAEAYRVVPGAQLQVMGVASRLTASGGTRCYVNRETCDIAQQTTAVSNYLGGVICGNPGAANTAPGSITGASAVAIDLYELAFWNVGVTNTGTVTNGVPDNNGSDHLANALVNNWLQARWNAANVAGIDTQLYLEGDSIPHGISTVLPTNPHPAGGLASVMTNPGAEMVPANVRVLNRATSGSVAAGIATRKDNANSIPRMGVLPGGPTKNIAAFQTGHNDFGVAATSPAVLYGSLVSLINSAAAGAEGFLQLGFSVALALNIGGPNTNISGAAEGSATLQTRKEALRALIADEATHTPKQQFLNDTLSNTGQQYDGRVMLLHLYDIVQMVQVGDQQVPKKWFYDLVSTEDRQTASPPGPYDSDSVHLVTEGMTLMAGGGATPEYSYRRIFMHLPIAANSNIGLAPLSTSSAGALPIKGTAGRQLGPVTGSGAGQLGRIGGGAFALEPVVASSAGTLGRYGMTAGTLGPVTSSSTGFLGQIVEGRTSRTLSPLLGTGRGRLANEAILGGTLAALLLDSDAIIFTYTFGGLAGELPPLTVRARGIEPIPLGPTPSARRLRIGRAG